MSVENIRSALHAARATNTVEWIYFEGGEPFLYYATLLLGVQMAHDLGFKVGVVSNAYWATDREAAAAALKPFADLLEDLSISNDLYHYDRMHSLQVQCASAAAHELGIPIGTISIAQPCEGTRPTRSGQLPPGFSQVMYRGRAAEKLASQVEAHPWQTYDRCPHEDLIEPGRVHLDPLSNVHICQGIVIGNLEENALADICISYDPKRHPIVDALLSGGPAELVRRFDLPHQEGYADACHLCYQARRQLRNQFPDLLRPDQMYGVY